MAAQLAGGNALRRGNGAAADQGPGPQEQDPVGQGQTAADQHRLDLRVALPDIGADTGEHFLGHHHQHGDGLMVVQGLDAGTGEHILVHPVIQRGFDAGLLVDAGEGGIILHIVRHGDDEAEALDRQGEAAEQGKLQLQIPLAVFSLHGLHRAGNVIVQGEGHFSGHIADDPGHIHLGGGGGFAGSGHAAVYGDICGIQRHRERQVRYGRIQAEPHGGGHEAVTVGGDGHNGIHLGRGALRRGRQHKASHYQQQTAQQHCPSSHPVTPFL